MDDAALMKKFGLSSKGLQSIFFKSMARGLITQEVLDHRGSEMEHTIDLRDEMLSLDHALRTLGTTVFPTDTRVARTRPEESDRFIERSDRKVTPARKKDEQPLPKSGPTPVVKPPWYREHPPYDSLLDRLLSFRILCTLQELTPFQLTQSLHSGRLDFLANCLPGADLQFPWPVIISSFPGLRRMDKGISPMRHPMNHSSAGEPQVAAGNTFL